MKRVLFTIIALLCIGSITAQSEIPHAVKMIKGNKVRRTEIILPQVNGYNCYKGDFHIHTSYSDGKVNPSGRVTEAWYDGLDIIAITDHYENRSGEKKFLKVIAPYNEDGQPMKYLSVKAANGVKADFNAIHQEAVMLLEKSKYPMLLIKGCEMGRNAKTHGHYNCLFLKDPNILYDNDLRVAFRRVHEQGGIVIHNHPAWRRDTSDKTEFHEEVYKEGLIDGVEVVNGSTFYPHMVRRCIDEKLTMFGNTDIHSYSTYTRMATPIHRTMTLVFAKELTEESVKEALLKHRTLAHVNGILVGEEKLLGDFLNAAVDCRIVSENKEKGIRTYRLTNNTSFAYSLRLGKKVIILEPFKPTHVNIGKDKKSGKYLTSKFKVESMYHVDYQHPIIEIELDK